MVFQFPNEAGKKKKKKNSFFSGKLNIAQGFLTKKLTLTIEKLDHQSGDSFSLDGEL